MTRKRPLGETDPKRLIGLTCGLFDSKHVDTFGGPLFAFGWCVRRQLDNEGWVLNGDWLTYSGIAVEMGTTRKNAERWLKKVESGGYIEILTATKRGIRVRVKDPKKRILTKNWDTYVPDDDPEKLPDSGGLDQSRTDVSQMGENGEPSRTDVSQIKPISVPDLTHICPRHHYKGDKREEREREEPPQNTPNEDKKVTFGDQIGDLRAHFEEVGQSWALEEWLTAGTGWMYGSKRRRFEPALMGASPSALKRFAEHAKARIKARDSEGKTYSDNLALDDLVRIINLTESEPNLDQIDVIEAELDDLPARGDLSPEQRNQIEAELIARLQELKGGSDGRTN